MILLSSCTEGFHKILNKSGIVKAASFVKSKIHIREDSKKHGSERARLLHCFLCLCGEFGVLIVELFYDNWTPFVKSIDQSGTVLGENKTEKMPGIIYSINGEAKSLSNEDIDEREGK